MTQTACDKPSGFRFPIPLKTQTKEREYQARQKQMILAAGSPLQDTKKLIENQKGMGRVPGYGPSLNLRVWGSPEGRNTDSVR